MTHRRRAPATLRSLAAALCPCGNHPTPAQTEARARYTAEALADAIRRHPAGTLRSDA